MPYLQDSLQKGPVNFVLLNSKSLTSPDTLKIPEFYVIFQSSSPNKQKHHNNPADKKAQKIRATPAGSSDWSLIYKTSMYLYLLRIETSTKIFTKNSEHFFFFFFQVLFQQGKKNKTKQNENPLKPKKTRKSGTLGAGH